MLVELYPMRPAKQCAPNGLHLLCLVLRSHLASLRLAWQMATSVVETGADVLRVTAVLLGPELTEPAPLDDPELAAQPLDELDREILDLLKALEN